MDGYYANLANRFLLLLTCLALAGCKKAENTQPGQPKLETRKVQTARVVELGVEETIAAQGALAAQDRAVLSAKVPGRLESIQVDMGKAVKEGDLLARIESRDYELRLLQAEAALAQARARLGIAITGEEDKVEPEKTSVVKEARAVLAEATKNRDRALKLREEGVIAEADVEAAEAAFQVASSRFDEAVHEAKTRMATLKERQAELAMAEQQLKDTEIRAPFPGIVERRQISPGEYLSVATPVVTVVRVDPIRARFEVVEKDAPLVRLGQTVHLQVYGMKETSDGKINRISPVIAAGGLMLLVEADAPNPKGLLRPGSFVKAQVVVNDNSRGLFVPQGAVSTFAGIHKIFLVHEGKAVEKEVGLGRVHGKMVEVLGEVEPGAMVVVEPGTLRNGQPIEMLAQES